MKQIELKRLSYPSGFNLDLLIKILPEEAFRELILANCKKERRARTITLPNIGTLKKVFCFHLVNKQRKGELTLYLFRRFLDMLIFQPLRNISTPTVMLKELL